MMQPQKRPLICGFLKVKNEYLRGNIQRCVANLMAFCDVLVACDDGSTDGTRELLQNVVRPECLVLVSPNESDFRKEMYWKQRMMEIVHQIQPYWIWWADGDEVLDAAGTLGIREFCQKNQHRPEAAWRSHYSQLWRSTNWARTDQSFDDGSFIKLWKWEPYLSFDVTEGTHRHQFPDQLLRAPIGVMPFETIHYGNASANAIRWKAIQYYGGLGGVDRHLHFEQGQYRPIDDAQIPPMCERHPVEHPIPFTADEIALIKSMQNLKGLEQWFTVVVPAYNRADTLPAGLDSLRAQTYPHWIALVLDDGSNDNTANVLHEYQELDQRIFYCRYPQRRGGVAMNEFGMTMACEMTEYWTRLGSDDWFEPRKLENDAEAFRAGAAATYGHYTVVREDGSAVGLGKHYVYGELCNPERPAHTIREWLTNGQFVVSWANVAIKTSVLQAVKARYGAFCDPRIVNCEDFLFNSRAVRFADFVWRGRGHDGRFYLGVEGLSQPGSGQFLQIDAVWRSVNTGASGNIHQLAADEVLTRKMIMQENAVR